MFCSSHSDDAKLHPVESDHEQGSGVRYALKRAETLGIRFAQLWNGPVPSAVARGSRWALAIFSIWICQLYWLFKRKNVFHLRWKQRCSVWILKRLIFHESSEWGTKIARWLESAIAVIYLSERLTENLRLYQVPHVHAQVFLCYRVLLLRLSPQYLVSMWPSMVTELVSCLIDIASLQMSINIAIIKAHRSCKILAY